MPYKIAQIKEICFQNVANQIKDFKKKRFKLQLEKKQLFHCNRINPLPESCRKIIVRSFKNVKEKSFYAICHPWYNVYKIGIRQQCQHCQLFVSTDDK